ncbi:MAG: reverse transcriptase family protein [Candidatus Thiodiazotropha sp. LLP2]
MSSFKKFVRLLSLSIKDGIWQQTALADRINRSLGDGFVDAHKLAARLLFQFDTGLPPSTKLLFGFLINDKQLCRFYESLDQKKDPRILLDSPVMGSLPERMITLPLPQLASWHDVRIWLGLSNEELAWFADREGRQGNITEPKLHHYRYRWVRKRSGEARLIEIPKRRLKAMQRQILKEILNQVPPHPSAHGFTRGRSCLTYTAQHLDKYAVMRMDLKDFFHSVPIPRIGATFKRLGYPQGVAHLLQGLCTHVTSASLAGALHEQLPWENQRRLSGKHLPQGAPSSPAIANLCAWGLDCRLSGLADRFGLNYSRYADDLAFSGSKELIGLAPYLQTVIGAIALEEGFRINHRKTLLRTQAQSQRLAGMVVNKKSNLSRQEYDRLKAILYNCVRFGPESQNRHDMVDFKSHLAGKIAYATWLNPERGARLNCLWQQIVWPDNRIATS